MSQAAREPRGCDFLRYQCKAARAYWEAHCCWRWAGCRGASSDQPLKRLQTFGRLWSRQSCSELRDCLCASPTSGCLLVGNYQFPNVRVHKQPDQYRGYDGPRSLRSDTTNPMAKFWQYPAPNCDIIRSYARTSRLSSPFQKFNSFSKGLNLFPRSEHLSSPRTRTLS